jgi:hypothetical protein
MEINDEFLLNNLLRHSPEGCLLIYVAAAVAYNIYLLSQINLIKWLIMSFIHYHGKVSMQKWRAWHRSIKAISVAFKDHFMHMVHFSLCSFSTFLSKMLTSHIRLLSWDYKSLFNTTDG